MSVSGLWYGKAFLSLLNKEVDVDTDTLKCMLTTSTYTPDQDAHQYKSSVTNEVSATGYTAAGQALTSVTVTYTGATNVLMIDCADPSWTITGSLTARNAVFYDSSPATDATRPLLVYQASSVDITATDGTFTVVINASGLATITVA
jgi:hypothetical protein